MKTARQFASILFVLFLLISFACPAFAEGSAADDDPNAATFELGIAGSDAGNAAVVSIGTPLQLELVISMPANYGKDPYTPYYFEFSFDVPSGLTLVDLDPDPEKSKYDIAFSLINEEKEFPLSEGYGLGTILWNDGRTSITVSSGNTRNIHSKYGAKEEYMVYSYSKFRFLIGCTLETLAPSDTQGLEVTYQFAHTNLTATDEADKMTKVPPQTIHIFNCDLSATVTDAKDGTPLPGAKFYLQNEDGLYFSDGLCWVENELMATCYTSDEQGMLTFTGIGDGKYTLIQTEAPKGYRLPEAPVVLDVASVCDAEGVHSVTVTAGDVATEDAPFSIQNEKDFPIVPVAVGATVVLILLIVLVVILLRRRKSDK